MARRATGMRTNPPKKGRGPGRPPVGAPKTAAKASKKTPAAAKQPAAPSARFTSKDELRMQLEKLERANATLRTKNREAGRAAKLAAARIVDLEEEVARPEKRVVSQAAAAKRARKPASAPSEPSQNIDPDDALSPGVTPEEPGSAGNAGAAREALEAHLQDDSRPPPVTTD